MSLNAGQTRILGGPVRSTAALPHDSATVGEMSTVPSARRAGHANPSDHLFPAFRVICHPHMQINTRFT